MKVSCSPGCDNITLMYERRLPSDIVECLRHEADFIPGCVDHFGVNMIEDYVIRCFRTPRRMR